MLTYVPDKAIFKKQVCWPMVNVWLQLNGMLKSLYCDGFNSNVSAQYLVAELYHSNKTASVLI